MSSLLISDVFESYYEGRKAPFSSEVGKAPAPKRGDEKPRKGPATENADDLSFPQAA